ncbi:DUF4065 domain-containing protein [Komagataeibacter oboediens]|uniref:Panacea domain-containing protein n=1 Tax=Komagataeibacter oboediens TaxID=65958 RepID=UPI001C2BF3BC|nr:type II toxin-antitoxin system antitoxin SocA domain-containing protein [Komagataeibacter oboediens]MBV0890011.1 DUF4065 domain-containing protein [Komagataeibacter oboediens]MCK9818611.1 DUF4065 domain-containing protein [Komagataeibacter oboediens]
MPNHNVAAIANEFLRRAKAEGMPLTNMQLQKLPYIAHGWGLVTLHQPLIEGQPKTWPYGPVYPELYQDLKRYGAGSVTDFVREHNASPFPDKRGDIVTTVLSESENKLLDTVWNKYKKFDGIELSTITHKEGTPWTIVKCRDGAFMPIDNDVIKNHYQALLEKNRAKSLQK